MKIAFITELSFLGKVDRSCWDNLRTEFAWMYMLDADNIPINQMHTIEDNKYDICIIIIPKKFERVYQLPILKNLKRISKKIAFMQEGPSWYYQDLPLHLSYLIFNIMSNVDFVLCHNEIDRIYYSGLLQKPTYVNPSLMIESSVDIPIISNRKNVILGGNMLRWYGGFDSYIIASEFDCDIFSPLMGKMKSEESLVQGINHLPYVNWKAWMIMLNEFKYAVHLMPTVAAGTFSLNCAYLGIPCIGNIKLNTQRMCFPKTSVDIENMIEAREVALQLKLNPQFYNDVSRDAINNYNKFYHSSLYKQQMEKIFNDILN